MDDQRQCITGAARVWSERAVRCPIGTSGVIQATARFRAEVDAPLAWNSGVSFSASGRVQVRGKSV